MESCHAQTGMFCLRHDGIMTHFYLGVTSMKKNTWKTVLTVVVLLALAAALWPPSNARTARRWPTRPGRCCRRSLRSFSRSSPRKRTARCSSACWWAVCSPAASRPWRRSTPLSMTASSPPSPATRASSCSSCCWASSSRWSTRRAAPPPSAAGPRRTSKRASARSWPRSCSVCSFSSTTISTA